MSIIATKAHNKLTESPVHVLFSSIVAAFLFVVAFAAQANSWPPGCMEGSLPSGDYRYPEPQLTVVCLPPNWNGALFVYAHGYEAPHEPLALPDVGFDGVNLAAVLMAEGFAFATSSYHKNGWAVEQAGDDLNNLVAHFNTIAPIPAQKVIAMGGSEGGLITTMLIEKYPHIYDGGLALCGPLGGANLEIRYLGDFRAVFDYFFPWVFNFGIVDGIPDDVYLYEDYYIALIAQAFQTYPDRVEQLFNVTNVPRDPADPLSDLDAALSLLGYAVMGFNDITEVAMGNPYGNRLRWYSGSDNDFLLNRKIERVRPSWRGMIYMWKYYKPTGKLQKPLVTAHTTGDEVVPFWHQIIYSSKVKFNNAEDLHIGIPVIRYGHCAFEPNELLTMIGVLLNKMGLPVSSTLANDNSIGVAN